MHSWMTNKVSELTWSKIHCRDISRWNSSSKWPPIKIVGNQLLMKDGQSVFVNGLGCGEWLDGLHSVYPRLKLFGIDKYFGSVHHVRSLVNGTYETRHAYDLLDLASEYHSFDHAIAPGTLSALTKQRQCDAVSRMLPMIKPGGSLYIGSNFESCDKVEGAEKILHMSKTEPLQLCFWSDICLKGRPDIAEIIYVHEEDAYQMPFLNPLLRKCASAVFIYKNIMITKHRDKKPLYPSLEFRDQTKPHQCSRSNIDGPKKPHHKIKEDIKKAVKDMKLRGLDMH